MELQPRTARTLWKAIMDNASSLILDAHLLLEQRSFGRARSLTVLAQEELGKALWVYERFAEAWNTGAEAAQEVPQLASGSRDHVVKYMEAFVFGRELAAFWGDYEAYEIPEDQSAEGWDAHLAKQQREARTAGMRANKEKMAGFYVDVDSSGTTVLSPRDISLDSTAADLQTAAQVVEMLLIKDHSRMKFDASTPYDSTAEQQYRLLPISHPDHWATASEELKRGDHLDRPQS